MGCVTLTNFANEFAPIGVVSRKPKIGRGNGGSYGYVHHYSEERWAGYACLDRETLNAVMKGVRAPLTTTEAKKYRKRHTFIRSMTRMPRTFTECNVLWIRDRDANLLSRVNYYAFMRTPEDAILFNLILEQLVDSVLDDRTLEGSSYMGYYEKTFR